MIKAAIDIGTNTVLLLITDVKKGLLNVKFEEHRVPRLGKEVDSTGNLSKQSIERVVGVLHEYETIVHQFGIDKPLVTATSAVRDAKNKSDFLNRVREETGWEIRILSGQDEATCTYLGALSVLETQKDTLHLVMDIGGGSTEFALGLNNNLHQVVSLDMGCVRFTERFLKNDPPKQEEIKHCEKSILSEFEKLSAIRQEISGKEVRFIAVAGTATTIAFMELDLKEFDSEMINGFIVTPKIINKWIDICSSATKNELISGWPLVMEGRADIFLSGLLIFKTFLKYFDIEKVEISTGGIRHGAILHYLK